MKNWLKSSLLLAVVFSFTACEPDNMTKKKKDHQQHKRKMVSQQVEAPVQSDADAE